MLIEKKKIEELIPADYNPRKDLKPGDAEYEKLKRLSPHEQVAWQIHYINKAIELWLKDVDENKKIVVDYEKFCEKPEDFFNELKQKLKLQWCDILDKYSGEKQFKVTRKSVTDENIINAYKKYYK